MPRLLWWRPKVWGWTYVNANGETMVMFAATRELALAQRALAERAAVEANGPIILRAFHGGRAIETVRP